MNQPLVSIIIPCYRQGHFLAHAIDSALGQSYSHVEVLVINDGSDDNTDHVAYGYGDRIRYIRQHNAGLPRARNNGLALAKGKYVLFLDSDDCLHGDAVDWLVAAAGGRDDVLCNMGWRFFERDDAIEGGFEKLPPRNEPLGLALMGGNPGPPHSWLCPRAMLMAIGGFDPSLKSCEDWDAWARMFFAGAAVIPVYKIGAFYRQHDASMSRDSLRMSETAIEVAKRILHRIQGHPLRLKSIDVSVQQATQAATDRMAEEFFNAGFTCREQGKYIAAMRNYWRSARIGGLRLHAISAMLKLLPHRVMRALGSAPSHSPTTGAA